MSPPFRSARGPTRAVLALFVCGVLGLALSACGGESSDSSASASGQSDEEGQQDAARIKLEECLEDQGVEAPGGPRGSGGQGGGAAAPDEQRPSRADMEELQEALEGPCKKYRDQAFGEITEEDRQEFEDARVKFESCLKKEGVDIESESNGGMRTFRIDGDDSETREAMDKCRKLLPDRGGGGPGLRVGPPPGGGGGDGD